MKKRRIAVATILTIIITAVIATAIGYCLSTTENSSTTSTKTNVSAETSSEATDTAVSPAIGYDRPKAKKNEKHTSWAYVYAPDGTLLVKSNDFYCHWYKQRAIVDITINGTMYRTGVNNVIIITHKKN